MSPPYLSVVTPVYGCAEALAELCNRLHVVLGSITTRYEIIMVNDASPDDSWEIIKSLAKEDSRVKGINLSRNFGQHYAITAGLEFSKGEKVVVMDCDLQDVPEEIHKLYVASNNGYDIVVGKREQRNDSMFRKFIANKFYKVLSRFGGIDFNSKTTNFGIYSRKVILSINKLTEKNRSFGLFALWVGFSRLEIDVIHAARPYGRSSYTFLKLWNFAFDSFVSHSNGLLHLTLMGGFALAGVSLVAAIILMASYFAHNASLPGWTSVIVSITFSTGIIVAAIGIVGMYVGKIFDEVKQRPLYIVSDTTFEFEE